MILFQQKQWRTPDNRAPGGYAVGRYDYPVVTAPTPAVWMGHECTLRRPVTVVDVVWDTAGLSQQYVLNWQYGSRVPLGEIRTLPCPDPLEGDKEPECELIGEWVRQPNLIP